MHGKLQAPQGGCFSQENGEWYQGGQFLPSTCMPKGVAKQVTKAAKVNMNIAELFISGCIVKARYAGTDSKKVLFFGKCADDARIFADALIEAKAKAHMEQGFSAHPTQIIFMN